MSIGNLQTEADLRRFFESELQRPGVLPAPSPPISKITNGVPSDSDFPGTPSDGIFALDKSTMTLYARVGGSWEAV